MRHNSARQRLIAAPISGTDSTAATARIERSARGNRSTLTMIRMANAHQPRSARLGSLGKPMTAYRFHISCPNSQQPVASAHSVHRSRFSGRARLRAATVPTVALTAAAVQATL